MVSLWEEGKKTERWLVVWYHKLDNSLSVTHFSLIEIKINKSYSVVLPSDIVWLIFLTLKTRICLVEWCYERPDSCFHFRSPLHEFPMSLNLCHMQNFTGMKREHGWDNLRLGAVTLQMVSRTNSADSPGWMMVSTGWSFGRHTQEGVRWSGTQMSLSVLGRGTLFTVPSSLFFEQRHWNAFNNNNSTSMF